MIHTLGKEYKLSKSEIDTYYPEEVITMLKFLAFEKHDEMLKKSIDYYMQSIDTILIHHSDPNEVRDSFKRSIEKLQSKEVVLVNSHDDDLPDRSRISALKGAIQQNRKK